MYEKTLTKIKMQQVSFMVSAGFVIFLSFNGIYVIDSRVLIIVHFIKNIMSTSEKSKTKNPVIHNTHAHCFTLDHVPDRFAKGYFPIPIRISWLRKSGILKWLVKNVPKLRKSDHDIAERLINLVKFGQPKFQRAIIDKLTQFYPRDSKYVFLTMDMKYMNAGEPKTDIYKQLKELAEIKKDEKYAERIFPFIFADPRRLEDDKDYFNIFKDYLTQKVFQGIKIYPALGYWPFDKRLMNVYMFAAENNIPVMTHCSKGVVHDRGPKMFENHPVKTGSVLSGTKAKDYTVHFTNPVNYECLLNPDILSGYWGITKAEAEKISKLKICLGHFGGSEEWHKYLHNPWLAGKDISYEGYPALEKKNWSFDINTKEGHFSWFSIICQLILKYDNVFADVSYMLSKQEYHSMLKVILESSEKIRRRVLFGSDYYVVAQTGSERELSFNLRGYLGEDLFKQIAETNPREYLSSDITKC